ncbi:MAG TPA: recombinase family protein [Croceibacterium sp.]|nr:recombinase family protein [Croceibacterium sp.]
MTLHHPQTPTPCAIYTRKSTVAGLERTFTTLDNQRAVCSAYIASQQHKGWAELPVRYDDAGQSGGTIERPALQRLLRDVEQGRVKIIVIYKVDRLTRSLGDFVRMMELFERYEVSFVSVTQAFDTSDSMGRLVLNILLTFAQFEREMLADRVRDKIAAMRRRGRHIGGPPPYGYDVVAGRLVVNEGEAHKVRAIFQRYRELGSYQKVREELKAEGMLTKVWRTRGGKLRGGTLVSDGMIYSLLRNPVYAGKVVYDGAVYQGEHQAILSEDTWAAVSFLRDERARHRARLGPSPNLLLGLLFDCHGRRMVMRIDHSRGRRFRYYGSDRSGGGGGAGPPRLRTPAAELEELVLAALRDLLCDGQRLRSAMRTLGRHGLDIERLLANGERVCARINRADLEQKRDLVVALVARGELASDLVTLLVRCAEIERLLAWDGRGRFEGRRASWTTHDPTLAIELGVRVVCGPRVLVLPLAPERPAAPERIRPELVRLIHHARAAQAMVDVERRVPLAELARRFNWRPGFFARVLRLNYLAPDIIAAILDGTQPEGLTRRTLIRGHLPMDWALQRQLLGFPARADHQRD